MIATCFAIEQTDDIYVHTASYQSRELQKKINLLNEKLFDLQNNKIKIKLLK